MLGEKYGEAMKRTFVDGAVWKPLYITGAAINANLVSLSYNIPAPPLALDTTLVSDPGNHGFSIATTRRRRLQSPRSNSPMEIPKY